MIPDKFIEQFVSNPDNRKKITTAAGDADTYALPVNEQIVEVNSTLGTLGLYMPDVGAAKGLTYSITALTGSTKTVTVYEKSSGNSLDWPANAALNADYDRILLQSDGKRWWIVTDQYT